MQNLNKRKHKGKIGDRYRKVEFDHQNINKKNKKTISSIVILATILLVATFGTTYALFTLTIKSKEHVEMQAGTLQIAFEEGNVIDLKNASPLTDAKGLTIEPYTFSIENNGTLSSKYTISIEEKEDNTLDRKYIRYSIKDCE